MHSIECLILTIKRKGKVNIMYTKKIVDGYYAKTVTYDKCLAFCPNGSCGVVFNENGIHLISYTTLVCSIDNDEFLSCTGTYSATTRKHISAFLKEFAPMLSYSDAKWCYENDSVINVNTGEVYKIENYNMMKETIYNC